MFLRTLGQMAKRTGIRVHGYALMDNHYHFVLETPKANLVDYVHLNPVRAGMLRKGAGFEAAEWTSLRKYCKPPSKRFEWIEKDAKKKKDARKKMPGKQ